MPLPKFDHTTVSKILKQRSIKFEGPYIGILNRCRFKCSVCKYIWTTRFSNVWYGTGCPKCRNKMGGKKRGLMLKGRLKYTSKQIKEMVRAKNPNYRVVGKYLGARNPLKTKCRKCGNTWNARIDHLLQGHGCPKCGGTTRLTLREVKLRLKKINAKINIISRKYETACKKLKLRCSKCLHIWKAKWSNLSIGQGCPKCAGCKSERRIAEIIEEITGWKFPKCKPEFLRGKNGHKLELDGYNAKHKAAFEYQGKQRYKKGSETRKWMKITEKKLRDIKKHDERKRVLCYNHGVTLIRVPYWKMQKGEDSVREFILGKFKKAGFRF